ncbi:MAG: DUF6036 family nucleotidyltransferase [Phycisphaerae bacterium]
MRISKASANQAIRAALAALGSELGRGHPTELLIVGGAAGLLTGLLSGSVTTSDVDAVNFRPPKDVEEILSAAQLVAEHLGLSKGWLSIDAGLYFNAIPDDWEPRRVAIGSFGRLRVYAIGRLDFIAMKFFAHRTVDLEHLSRIVIQSHELAFAAQHLKKLPHKLPNDINKIEMALHILQNWEKSS